MDFEKFDQDVEKLQCASTFEDIFYLLRTFTASGKFVEMMIMYEVLGDQRCDVDLDKRVQIHGERRRPKLRDLLSSDGHSPQAHVDPIRDHIIQSVMAAAGMGPAAVRAGSQPELREREGSQPEGERRKRVITQKHYASHQCEPRYETPHSKEFPLAAVPFSKWTGREHRK